MVVAVGIGVAGGMEPHMCAVVSQPSPYVARSREGRWRDTVARLWQGRLMPVTADGGHGLSTQALGTTRLWRAGMISRIMPERP